MIHVVGRNRLEKQRYSIRNNKYLFKKVGLIHIFCIKKQNFIFNNIYFVMIDFIHHFFKRRSLENYLIACIKIFDKAYFSKLL